MGVSGLLASEFVSDHQFDIMRVKQYWIKLGVKENGTCTIHAFSTILIPHKIINSLVIKQSFVFGVPSFVSYGI